MTVTIDTRDPGDRWRYTCPNGHRTWEPTNHHFWCAQCAQHNWVGQPEFESLRDRKTGELVSRDNVRLR